MADQLPSSVLHELGGVVGEEWVINDPDRLVVYEADAQTAHNQAPQAVVLPAETTEVAGVFEILHRSGIPVVAVPIGF